MNTDPKPPKPEYDIIEDDDPFGVDEDSADDGSLDIEEEGDNWLSGLDKVVKKKEKSYERG